MKKTKPVLLLISIFVITNLARSFSVEITWHSSGNGGAVAAGPASSVQAGIDMLSRGGNAVDGAVAAIFNLAISDYGSFCMGGEVPFMFYGADNGKVIVFNGMGSAPLDKKAIEQFYKNGIPPERKGIQVSTVPSAISTLLTALEMKGTMSFEEVIAPTLHLLDTGKQPWYKNLAATLRRMIETEKNTKGTREQKIRAARDRFYKGDIADELDKFYISSGGYLRKADLEAHTTTIEEPVTIQYRGYTINKCNTWTQGPVLLQTLRLLENFDLKSMGYLSPDFIHVTTEAMKLAYADRDKYYGDPAFVNVPLKQFLSDQYTKIRYPLINMKQASKEIRPGDPVKMIAFTYPGEYWPGEEGTTTCVVVDKWGNAVAATPSANGTYSFCTNLGFPHNTRLTSFNTQKGHPNSIQPGKRPRITLTPTIVLKNGKPFLVMSVAGGDMQDQVGLQLFLQLVEFGTMPKEAISSPRYITYHIQDSFNPSPDPAVRMAKICGLEINETDQKTIDNLKSRSHDITIVPGPLAYPAMVYIDQKTGICYAATEPLYARVNNRGKFCAALNVSR